MDPNFYISYEKKIKIVEIMDGLKIGYLGSSVFLLTFEEFGAKHLISIAVVAWNLG